MDSLVLISLSLSLAHEREREMGEGEGLNFDSRKGRIFRWRRFRSIPGLTILKWGGVVPKRNKGRVATRLNRYSNLVPM